MKTFKRVLDKTYIDHTKKESIIALHKTGLKFNVHISKAEVK